MSVLCSGGTGYVCPSCAVVVLSMSSCVVLVLGNVCPHLALVLILWQLVFIVNLTRLEITRSQSPGCVFESVSRLSWGERTLEGGQNHLRLEWVRRRKQAKHHHSFTSLRPSLGTVWPAASSSFYGDFTIDCFLQPWVTAHLSCLKLLSLVILLQQQQQSI